MTQHFECQRIQTVSPLFLFFSMDKINLPFLDRKDAGETMRALTIYNNNCVTNMNSPTSNSVGAFVKDAYKYGMVAVSTPGAKTIPRQRHVESMFGMFALLITTLGGYGICIHRYCNSKDGVKNVTYHYSDQGMCSGELVQDSLAPFIACLSDPCLLKIHFDGRPLAQRLEAPLRTFDDLHLPIRHKSQGWIELENLTSMFYPGSSRTIFDILAYNSTIPMPDPSVSLCNAHYTYNMMTLCFTIKMGTIVAIAEGGGDEGNILSFTRYLLLLHKDMPNVRNYFDISPWAAKNGDIPPWFVGAKDIWYDFDPFVRSINRTISEMTNIYDNDRYTHPVTNLNILPKFRNTRETRWGESHLNVAKENWPESAASYIEHLKEDEINVMKTSPKFKYLCSKCGKFGHSRGCCMERIIPCDYPLCPTYESTEGRQHAIRVCNALHSICTVCGKRGHRMGDHLYHHAFTLEQIFHVHSSRGIYTCLPWLKKDKGFWRQPDKYEIRFGYHPGKSVVFEW